MKLESVFMDFLAYDDTDRIVHDVSETLGCPVMVINSAFRVVAYACPNGFDDPVFLSAVRRREMTYEFASMMKEHGGQGCIYTQIDGSSFRRRFSVLKHGGVLLGYLICVDVRGDLEQAPEKEISLMEALIAKQMIFDYHRSQVISNDAEEVLCHLLDGEYASETHFQVQASATFLADLEAERIALISLKEYHSLDFLDDTLRSELRRVFYASHPFFYNSEVILFLNRHHDCRQFEKLIGQYRLRVVVSDRLPRLYSLPEIYRDARQVMDRLLRGGQKRLAWVEEYHDVLLLSRLQGAEELMHPEVAALAEYDARHRSDYCRTLLSYLLNNRSLQKTCEELCMHRNTVLYRIDKMKESFQLDIDSREGQLSLTVSAAMAVFRQDESLFIRDKNCEYGRQNKMDRSKNCKF